MYKCNFSQVRNCNKQDSENNKILVLPINPHIRKQTISRYQIHSRTPQVNYDRRFLIRLFNTRHILLYFGEMPAVPQSPSSVPHAKLPVAQITNEDDLWIIHEANDPMALLCEGIVVLLVHQIENAIDESPSSESFWITVWEGKVISSLFLWRFALWRRGERCDGVTTSWRCWGDWVSSS